MAQYLVLIYGDEKAHADGGQKLWDELMEGHTAFGEKHVKALAGGNALQDTSTATSIRKDASGSFVVTDGPFAETKEALGGYYLIEAADLDEAIAIAKDVPAPHGGLEVRPVMVFN
ncbi:MAG TPA: YciI family protein [Mycobacteriales bacterium]|nr:YciI family protein [Mycobacteriales bacterium]